MAEFLAGDIGGVPKKWVAGGVAIGGIVIGVVYFRSKKQSSANASTTVTDPAGNVCSALDPNSGYCPGSPQDVAYQQGQYGGLVGQNAASYVGGQIIGYDQNGNPIYSSGPSQPGPGSFTSNAQWAQASELYLTQTEPNADPAVIAEALGLYINGKAVTADQAQIVDQAIAFEGIPPVGGPNGDPPNIITSTGSVTGGTPQVTVPNVIGMGWGAGHNAIIRAGLVPVATPTPHTNTSYKITAQSPKAGIKVNKGSTVTCTVPKPKSTKPSGDSGGDK
jgi:hypothetical protein